MFNVFLLQCNIFPKMINSREIFRLLDKYIFGFFCWIISYD